MYNLSGGIKAWFDQTAIGPEDLGLQLFSGHESPAHTLTVAYSLEQGLRDFYLSLAGQVNNQDAKDLFIKLAEVEIKHQDSLFAEYLKVTDHPISRKEFEESIVVQAVEGGLTTEEYIQLYTPARESVSEVVSIAMAIEAQALDLYLRASEKAIAPEIKKSLAWIASEEKNHLRLLGELIDRTAD